MNQPGRLRKANAAYVITDDAQTSNPTAAGRAATERTKENGMTENTDDELQFAPAVDDKWRPKNATVHQLSDGSPAITAWGSR